jgi:hypothetical protein
MDEVMVTTAWEYTNNIVENMVPTSASSKENLNQNIIPIAQANDGENMVPTIASSIEDYLRFQDANPNFDFLKIVDEIPASSMLNGQNLKDLLGPDDESSISNRLLDWLALYTGNQSRIHLTSRCSYDVAPGPNSSTGNNSFSFPVIALTSSPRLVFPFKINGEIKGICEISPMPTKPDSTTEAEGAESKKNAEGAESKKKAEGAYNNATHQVHLNYMRIRSIIRLLILLMRRNIITNMRFLIRLKQSVLRIS